MNYDFGNALHAVHVLGAAIWVGGMGFALFVLRPSLGLLPPAQRLTLHHAVFARFFRLIWHVMPIVILTGYAMVFFIYGGFAEVLPAVHVMHATGLLMAVLFAIIVLGPWRELRAALAKGDTPAAAAAVDKIRKLVLANFILGTLTIVVAAYA